MLKVQKAILLIVIAVTSIIPILFVDWDEPTRTLVAIKFLAKSGSLIGTMLLIWQFLLGFRGAVSMVIPDLLWNIDVHKKIGTYALFLIVLHPIFITVYYAMRFRQNVWRLEVGSSFDMYVSMGIFGFVVILIVVLTSIYLRKPLGFDRWYHIHLSSYLILPLIFIHSLPIGMTLAETNLRILWWFLVGLVVVFYVCRALWRFGVFSKPYGVVSVTPAASQTTEITMKPIANGMDPAIGQFIFFKRGRWGGARPYTVSEFDPATGELSATIKALGPTSGDHQTIRRGETIYLDGPFGVFTREAIGSGRPIVMVAGGIGITPFRRLFEKLERESDKQHYLFYGNTQSKDIAYKDEFEAGERVKVVHAISDEPEYEGEKGFITTDLMKKYIGDDLKRYEFLICGPPVMTTKLEKELSEQGVPDDQIHHELFDY